MRVNTITSRKVFMRRGRPRIDISGKRFGMLIVHSHFGGKDSLWLCECDCGNLVYVASGNLRAFRQLSCGCIRRTAGGASQHGAARNAEYKIYKGAKERCTNPNSPAHEYYFDRGVQFKFANFEEFYAELGARPTAQHSIDRFPNNNGHYEKGNVRWAVQTEQIANRVDRGKLGNNQFKRRKHEN
jgi:hypothetical protein